MAQWRRFAFFDKEVLKDANGPWMKGVEITSMSANRGLICVGDADGFVHLTNRSLEARKYQAHELFVSHVVMVRHPIRQATAPCILYFFFVLTF
ncbi:hypothetical protein PsorP6_004923 [Peronosclerospora sorghi]|uniref:Uncharacterized protein n=1 Tax=Peronosclerospora sorghi TaxID=230839 RepID=A0ACC0W653_9STRA|nr:hypothetical protein PsorP6_004923 [Peronosclerospora sorghi]